MFDFLLVASASDSNARNILNNVVAEIVNPIITLFFIFAFAVFAYGIFEFVKGADEPEARSKGQKHILYGIAGFLIMVAVFAIIRMVMNTFGIDSSNIFLRF